MMNMGGLSLSINTLIDTINGPPITDSTLMTPSVSASFSFFGVVVLRDW